MTEPNVIALNASRERSASTMSGYLMLFVLLLGPTLFIMKALLENIGYYLQHLPQLATWLPSKM